MSTLTFKFDESAFQDFSRTLKRMRRRTRVATAFMLNEFAFGSREMALEQVFPQHMTIRNKGFVRRALRVEKAKTSADINAQQSVFGSVGISSSPLFSGWQEQQFGKAAKREHAGTLLSRGKSKSRAVQQRMRMRSGVRFQKPRDVDGSFKSDHHRAVVFIELLKRTKALARSPFFLHGHNKFPDGLYVMRGGGKSRKPAMVQTLSPSQTVRRVRWAQITTKAYFNSIDLDREWLRVWKRVVYVRLKKKF